MPLSIVLRLTARTFTVIADLLDSWGAQATPDSVYYKAALGCAKQAVNDLTPFLG